MPIRCERLESSSVEALKAFLDELKNREAAYAGSDQWSEEALAELPEQLLAFGAYDSEGAAGLLFFCPGVLEAWGAPTDLLGANPILSDVANREIHSALLLEAKTWASGENLSGLEILLPMGPANLHLDDCNDVFYEDLGFVRFYYTMIRELDPLAGHSDADHQIKVVPAATIPVPELYENFAACVAQGEIEFMTSLSDDDRRKYFDSLLEDTLTHPGSLALLVDDSLIGFALGATTSETVAHLAWIGVLPDHRNKSLGRQLLCHVMETCREGGIVTMSLYTDTDVGAQTLYHSLGFEPAGALTYRWRRKPPNRSLGEADWPRVDSFRSQQRHREDSPRVRF